MIDKSQLRQAPRPQNMSQLDYLWTYFGPYSVSEIVNATPAEDKVLTEAAVVDYINKTIGSTKSVSKLEIVQKEGIDFKDKLELRGKTSNGDVITFVDLDKDTKVTKFEQFLTTQEDVDNGIGNAPGELWIVLQDSTGKRFDINLNSFQYIGQETDSIVTYVQNSRIASLLKINNPIIEPTVEISSTKGGIRADIVFDPESKSGVKLLKTNKGIKASYVWEGEQEEIKFKSLTYNEYVLNPRDSGTLYFVTDLPCIYFREVKYGSLAALLDYFTKVEVNELLDKKVPWVVADKDGVKYNTIALDNHANLLGKGTDGVTDYNLAMISKWDVADFGSKSIPINFNGFKTRPTYNDTEEIALVADVDAAVSWIEV